MAKLWDAQGLNTDSLVEQYTAAGDAELDNYLVRADIYTNAAHVRMLESCGYLAGSERQKIIEVLGSILEEYTQGQFVVCPEDEDVHTKIENTVTERLGEPGRKIHTGRSRNDQVLSDMRLFCRDELFRVINAALDMADALLTFAGKHRNVAMPGYTHMQRAMPSSVALWAGAFAESLCDDVTLLFSALNLNSASPLGSGAGYGVSLSIDRDLVRRLLGFDRIQVNPIYCQNSRGKIEGAVLAALSAVMQTLGRFASDTLLYTTAEYAFFRVPDSLCTGSSIMPQKKNLDIMELLRARVRTVLANENLVKSVPGSLPSGYSRDLQETKRPVIESFSITHQSLLVATRLLEGLAVNTEKMQEALSPDLYATDRVFDLVEAGRPFREAYRIVKEDLDSLELPDTLIKENGAATPGTVANPGLVEIAAACRDARTQLAQKQGECQQVINSLLLQE